VFYRVYLLFIKESCCFSFFYISLISNMSNNIVSFLCVLSCIFIAHAAFVRIKLMMMMMIVGVRIGWTDVSDDSFRGAGVRGGQTSYMTQRPVWSVCVRDIRACSVSCGRLAAPVAWRCGRPRDVVSVPRRYVTRCQRARGSVLHCGARENAAVASCAP